MEHEPHSQHWQAADVQRKQLWILSSAQDRFLGPQFRLVTQPKVHPSRFPSGALLPFSFLGSLVKPNSRTKGILVTKGLLGNLQSLSDATDVDHESPVCCLLPSDYVPQFARHMRPPARRDSMLNSN